MKLKIGLLVVAALLISACGRIIPSVTVEAQSLPVSRTLLWDAPASGCTAPDGPCTYTVRLDGSLVATGISILSQPVSFTTVGAHTVTVAATNTWGTSSPASLNVNVVIPAIPGNPRLQ